jgi:hypothetical protein
MFVPGAGLQWLWIEWSLLDIQTAADEYVQQLVEHYLDHDVWIRQKVNLSLSQLDRGEFLSHEEVGARLRKLLRS